MPTDRTAREARLRRYEAGRKLGEAIPDGIPFQRKDLTIKS